MTVLVLGASSQIGRFLLPRLRAAGYGVLAISRRPRPDAGGVRWLSASLPDDMPAQLPPLRGIVSYGPLRELAGWLGSARIDGTPHVVATSSMSAQTKRASPVAAERAIAQRLLDGEQALAEVCGVRGWAWTVLRPTLVYGAGIDRSLTPIARRAMRWRVFPLPAGGGWRQPVHADDIAQASLAAMDAPAANGRILQIGGGERLAAAAMFARVRESLPVATLPLPVPAPLLRAGARVLPRLRGPLLRLEEDLVADNAELSQLLGVHPRPFAPDARCWGLAGR